MKLSELLKQDHECGDFGQALDGYAERAEKLEKMLWDSFYDEAHRNGTSHEKAAEYANSRMRKL